MSFLGVYCTLVRIYVYIKDMQLIISIALMVFLLSGLFLNPVFASMEDAEKAFKAQEYDKAFGLFEPLAESGNAKAQSALCMFYQKGKVGLPGSTVSQDFSQAVKWCTLSANQGQPIAIAILAWLYAMGHGVERDPIKAFILSQQVAELTNRTEYTPLKYIAELSTKTKGQDCQHCPRPKSFSYKEKNEIRNWALINAQAGDSVAQYLLAYMYKISRRK